MNTFQVTLLVENTAHGLGILAEHGLAYWIETGGQHILFDSGQGGAMVGNAFRMGIGLRDLDIFAVSHGHYDHTGGAADVLKTNRPVEIYAHPAALAPKFAQEKDGGFREIGMPYPSEQAIRNSGHTLIEVEQPTVLAKGLTITGPVPRRTDFENTGGPFFLDKACTQPDPLVDDQSLFFDTKKGLVVLLGCAHSGVINTLDYIRELADNRPIHTVIGGMHLVNASSERIEKTIEGFRRIGVERLMPGHCTGFPATAALWDAFPGHCTPCHTGIKLSF